MGQAKKRGSFEERRDQSIQKAEELKIRKIEAERLRLASMTPEERRKENLAKLKFAKLMSIAAGINCGDCSGSISSLSERRGSV